MKYLLLFTAVELMFNSTANAAPKSLDGQAIFTKNCSVCHSINPPPKLAPPIVPIISRYHLKFSTKEDGVAHLAAFLKLPNKQDAVDQQAITRFGLMPPIALSPAELKAVAAWVWDQYNPAMGTGRGFGGRQWQRNP
jgi:cytochrome c